MERSLFAYCGDAVRIAVACGLVVAIVLALAILFAGEVSVEFNIDLEFERVDALWFLLLMPLAALLVTIVTAPIAWMLLRIQAMARRRA